MLAATRPRPQQLLQLARLAQWPATASASRLYSASTSDHSNHSDHSGHSGHSDMRTRLLRAALAHVPRSGWTTDALAAGAADLGLPPTAHGIVRNGAIGLLDFFLAESNRAAFAAARANHSDLLGSPAIIKPLCLLRLEQTKPVLPRWPEALGLIVASQVQQRIPSVVVTSGSSDTPNSGAMALAHLHAFADEALHLAGDRSAAMDWYAKRAALSGVYAAAELFMVEDQSPEHRATSEFLDRRLKDVESAGHVASEVGKLASFFVRSAVNIAHSRGALF